ncbi:MAG: exo-alpha-sialidase [Candidatus Pseudobacter hemicellulosilyticus]|uniref:Exo-alpha-sialidase n=1 Tax=Candidatus Pseudobacter hemicellulosilyticus TaxID=3121375 RepID=A0AAJ5WUX0_9BACT|nr:MAG: exo-alpha-sialidase [Pseudobacter sp.]
MKIVTIACAFVLLAFAACGKNNTETAKIPETDTLPAPFPDELPPTATDKPLVNIEWDHGSTRKLSHDVYFADYGRMYRLPNQDLLLTYGCGPDASNTRVNIVLRRSSDNGVTWSSPEILLDGMNSSYYRGFANAELLVMQNGWLMLTFGGKAKVDDNVHNDVQIAISKDNGYTWGAPVYISKGRYWEPYLIQLPDGEIELFWSSEAKWFPSSDVQQEILMSRSKDNGLSWSTPITVAYATGMRDGMPTPLILKDNKGMVFTIESIRDSKSPYVLWSSMEARWNYQNYGTMDNKRRWLAITENKFGAAPHIVQLGTGETLLAFQENDGRVVDDWRRATMLVYRGNSVARNFERISDPWPDLPTTDGAYYSSLFVKDQHQVVMVTTKYLPDNRSEIWWKEGRLVDNYPRTSWVIKDSSSGEPVNDRVTAKLLDADVNTFWIARYSTNPTKYPDHFVTIDMGQRLAVDGFTAVQKSGDRKIQTMQILASDDATAWTDLGTFTLANKLNEQVMALPQTSTFRYFKIVPKTGHDSQQQPGLAEISAFKYR